MTYIEVQDLFFSYDDTPILEKVELKIKKGEFIGIFGPNGGGKTTFLKLLMGFLKPQKGSISLSCERIGYVPQAAQFDRQFPISALEVVLQGCSFSPWGFFSDKSKARAKLALSQVGLQGRESQAFGTLSGGQAQRVLIARALVSDPDLLLLDEPTASIDTDAEEVIYRLLSELKGKITILMVTHDLQAILQKADRLLCIQRELSSYSPAEVCEHFAVGLYHPPLKKKPQ
jgi:zinc transport system ATP-binding protein